MHRSSDFDGGIAFAFGERMRLLSVMLAAGLLVGCSNQCSVSATVLALSLSVTASRGVNSLGAGVASAGVSLSKGTLAVDEPLDLGGSFTGGMFSVALDSLDAELVGLDLLHLRGDELVIGQVLQERGLINAFSASEQTAAYTLEVADFAKPQLPDDLGADNWVTPAFLQISVSASAADALSLTGMLSASLQRQTGVEWCCKDPLGCE
jgi:hypothetical protein